MLQTAPIFQSEMILQRKKPIIIWGTGIPGETVKAQIQGVAGQTIIKSDGSWKLSLPPLNASEREQLVIESDSDKIIYEQVAVGEVWLAGGQSNMEFWIRYEKHKKEALDHCPDLKLRFYDVPEICYDGQLKEFDYSRHGFWRKAVSDELEYFSAVGYYFQKELKDHLNVPVGIIGCNWGGTRFYSWMNPETVKRAGALWQKDHEDRIASMDMKEYWKNQHGNPLNDRGNPFANIFGEFVLPGGRSDDELNAFFSHLPDDFKDRANRLQPQQIPGSLFKHMLCPIAPYAIKGVLWYQGESDDIPGRNVLYKDMLSGLIADWRELWHDNELPFLIVQLPGFDHQLMNPAENHFQVIRKCQEIVADTVNHTYLCSISDAGEEKDIHPKDKKTVGLRLALLARGHVYGEKILCDAPRARSAAKTKDSVIITFDHAEGGLKIKGDQLNAMQIGSNGLTLEYNAYTEKDKLILKLPNMSMDAISIDFAQTPWYQVNLYNQAGIPAVPFHFIL